MKNSFSTDSIEKYAELVQSNWRENFGESETATYDFTRCLRTDGSSYGTSGKCRKGVETSVKAILDKTIPGRVPRNDPKEPLASGNTPLEKAQSKLEMFEKLISDPLRTPSEKELEQYGKLKLAVESFTNKREGKKVPLLKRDIFQWEDRSDLDKSESRKLGKSLREVVPDPENRKKLARAKMLVSEHLKDNKDPLRAGTLDVPLKVLEKRKQDLQDLHRELDLLKIMGKYKGKSRVPSLIAQAREKLISEYHIYDGAIKNIKSLKSEARKDHKIPNKKVVDEWRSKGLSMSDALKHGINPSLLSVWKNPGDKTSVTGWWLRFHG